MSSSSNETQLITNSSSGMLDEFGTGGVVNDQAALFPVPSEFASMPQDGWFIAQWGQPVAINPSNYVANDSMSYDQLYGNSLYTWSAPGATAAISLYQNTAALGGGDVLQLSDGSTQSSTLSENDIFLTTPNISQSLGNLSHPITLTLDAKVLQAVDEFVNQNTGAPIPNGGNIWNNIDIGFTINFNGADGLPRYGGFVQITPWSAQSNGANPNYESYQANGFISSLLLGGDPFLAQLPADARATPDALTYNINKYVYQTLEATYGNQSTANKAVFLNLSNWSVGGMYIGLATDNWPNVSAASLGAEISSTVQLSNIGLTSNETAIYNPSTPPSSLPIVDTNPQINFIDNTSYGVQGTVDGAVYTGSLPGIQDEYIYNGYDSISLMAPASANWYFGGGYGQTTLSATSGNNVFLASMGGSTMTGGSGTDTFIIPEADTGFSRANDSIINFHVGDSATLEGVGGAGWTYQWLGSGGLTMDASNATLGLSELVTFSGLTMDDTNHLNVTTDASGNLSIVSTNAGAAPAIMVRDNTTGKDAYQFGKYSGIVLSPVINEIIYVINYQMFVVPTAVQDVYLYSGNDNISMTAPVGKNWEFGGGSGFTTLTAVSGFNTFVASTGSSLMIGGTGTNVAGTSVPMSEDTFVIPNANLTGVSTSDTIVNFHVGDTVTLNGVGGSGWTYAWYTESSGGNYSGLTLYATSATTPGLTELVTFSGLTVNNLNYFSVTTTPTGDLSIISTNVDPPPTIPLYDQTTGQSSIETGSFSPVSTASDPIGFTGVQSVFAYTGSDKIILSAPAGANWTFGGGSGLTGLVATSGDNVFKASTGSSFMIGGTGFDTFDIPDANLTGQSTWDTVVNFHVGDIISLAGLSGTGWKYQWLLNDGAQCSTGLTLYATSTNTLGLSELVTFSGLTADDLSHMKITSDATTGILTIADNASTSNSPVLLAFDQTTGQPVIGGGTVNTDPTIVSNDGTIISNIWLYNGSDTMQFIAPPNDGSWEFGGGSGQTGLSGSSGNNILLASTGSSWMTGGSGHNQFIVPDATLTGVPTWDTITDFHAGDSVILKDLLGPAWSYFFAPQDMGATGNMGLTLEAKNPSMPGSAEMVTFSNLHASNLASLILSQGTGANYGNLIISMSPLPA